MRDALALPASELVADRPPGLHPTRSARIEVAGQPVGYVGEIDPAVLEAYDLGGRVGWLELDLTTLLAVPHGEPRYHPISRYPSSDVDLAFAVADDVPAGAIGATLREAAGDLLADLWLFDVYRDATLGEGRRSLAYRLRLQAADRTLTDADVAAVRAAGIDAVTERHGASLRA